MVIKMSKGAIFKIWHGFEGAVTITIITVCHLESSWGAIIFGLLL